MAWRVGSESNLAPPNVAPGWTSGAWGEWDPPVDAVRGESHHREALLQVFGSPGLNMKTAVEAVLTREPLNPYDRNAVRVEVAGAHVGYIAKELAEQLSPHLDGIGCPSFSVAGLIDGGGYGGGGPDVWLWFDKRLTTGPDIDIPPETAVLMLEQKRPRGLNFVAARGEAIDAYFRLRDQIQDAWSARDFVFIAQASLDTMKLMNDVVAEVLAQEGTFWTSVPPAIMRGGPSLALLGNRDGLDAMRAVVAASEQLMQWLPDVDEAIEDEALTRTLMKYVLDHPGVIQRELHGLLDVDKACVQRVCWMSDKGGTLRRSKIGASYSLTLV